MEKEMKLEDLFLFSFLSPTDFLQMESQSPSQQG